MNTKLCSLALAALLSLALPPSSRAAVAVGITVAPPLLPVVVQPPVPVEGYIWTPGYWAYGPFGYYWVPGVWVPPPEVGFLWTPPWWGFAGGGYVFHEGYWGSRVGYYGGINYGFGYFGTGYYGGFWDGPAFRYNTAVTRVNTTVIRNVYVDRTVLSKQTQATAQARRASFNGPGGVKAESNAEEQAAANARHVAATPEQTALRETAGKNRALRASVNHGHPNQAAIKSVREKIQKQPRAAQTTQKQPGAAQTATASRTKAANKPGTAAKASTAERKARTESQSVAERRRPTATAPRREMSEAPRPVRRPEPVATSRRPVEPRGQAPTTQQRKSKKAKPEKAPGAY
jgi:WXXGXW repeat (2 copies)